MRVIVETGRLLIRTLTEADIPALAELWSDPRAARYLGGPRDPLEVGRLLREDLGVDPPCTLWPVVVKESGAVIGHCGLLEKEVEGRPEIELIYVVAPEAQGRGYAGEAAAAIRDHALGKLGCRRLIALVHPENAASARVALRAGFSLEGETRRPSGTVMQVYALAADST
jgi:RimJ/RimL family protein N-acetyltransferase